MFTKSGGIYRYRRTALLMVQTKPFRTFLFGCANSIKHKLLGDICQNIVSDSEVRDISKILKIIHNVLF